MRMIIANEGGATAAFGAMGVDQGLRINLEEALRFIVYVSR